MQTELSDFSALLPAVRQLARRAGQAILSIYDAASPEASLFDLKADQSPVTAADRLAHQCIVEGLQALTPGVPVVSEEDPASMAALSKGGAFWLVDPLDGTKEFLRRNGEFTVNIALVMGGEAVWGVVYVPVLAQMYWGGSGLGAFREVDEKTMAIRVSEQLQPGSRYRVVASKSHLNAETRAFIERLGGADLLQAGSSLKFCRVAEGAADVYPRLAPTCQWDTAAAQAVVEGAGGYVVDLQGLKLGYGQAELLNPNFVAAALPLHKFFKPS